MTASLNFDHVTLTDRPLIICDIDEVVLEFLTPFRNFLRSSGHDLLARSFRLHGNIVLSADGLPIDDGLVDDLLEQFFTLQDQWQTPATLAVETLESLADEADLVFLTAMPPRHAAVRRSLLDHHRLHYPLLATEEPKGPVVQRLHDSRDVPVAFVDDILRNLHSVRSHAPQCLLVNVMANAEFRVFAPEPDDGIVKAADWTDVARIIRSHFAR
ncbi:hypothetical protein [Pararhizobium antarcticum]|uniref:HAD family hydrolase n=1 Tax=Pararhizobium antarcticum TaxID=1798805 RepID=A0A657LYA2_9HYPH|nr:hypothetical protein [Pararhizobium antarcticum]OJG00241.1 hypothetical protein AX760_10985 [Pararhizobium antarcticum]